MKRFFRSVCLLGICLCLLTPRSLAQATKEISNAPQGISDFDFFMGEWVIKNRRAKNVQNPAEGWDEFDATQYAYKILNGYGNRDHFKTVIKGEYYEGMSIRLFDPEKEEWHIYWADTNTPGLANPTIGKFEGKTGSFFRTFPVQGPNGPLDIKMRFLWKDVNQDSAYWDNAWSMDDGQTWNTTWTMEINRTEIDHHRFKDKLPTPNPAAQDFVWQVGTWKVHNKKLRNPQDSDSWQEFEAEVVCKPHLNGLSYINTFTAEMDGEPFVGNSIRFYDAKAESWKMYWIDTNNPAQVGDPVIGTFENGVGTFYKDLKIADNQIIQLRSLFSDITETTARWESAWSADQGKTWHTTWIMEFSRK